MKAYSATMIIGIIIAVIIGVAVLYFFWVKGMRTCCPHPTIVECKTMLIENCQQAADGGWGSDSYKDFINLKICEKYKLVPTVSNFDCCIDNTCASSTSRESACKAMCQEIGKQLS